MAPRRAKARRTGLAPGSAGGTGRIEDAAAQAVATETAKPNRLQCARLSSVILAPHERRAHAKTRRRDGGRRKQRRGSLRKRRQALLFAPFAVSREKEVTRSLERARVAPL